jgi:MADS-box transcription factor
MRCRHLKGEDLNSLQSRELIAIEEALTNGQTTARQAGKYFICWLQFSM